MAYDAFLYFPDTIEGETLDSVYASKKAIQVFSFSWGESNPTTVGVGSGLSGGKVSMSSLNIMKRVDNASTDFALCCASGLHLKSCTLVLRKSSGKKPIEYLTVIFTDVMIESVQWSGASGGDDYPTESVSIAYADIAVSYIPQQGDGAPGKTKNFKWNIVTNANA